MAQGGNADLMAKSGDSSHQASSTLNREQSVAISKRIVFDQLSHEDDGHGHGHGGHGHAPKAPSIVTAFMAALINFLLMFGLCCAYGIIMFDSPHNASHRALGVKMNLGNAMLMGTVLAGFSGVPVAIGGPDLNPVVIIGEMIGIQAMFIQNQQITKVRDKLTINVPEMKSETTSRRLLNARWWDDMSSAHDITDDWPEDAGFSDAPYRLLGKKKALPWNCFGLQVKKVEFRTTGDCANADFTTSALTQTQTCTFGGDVWDMKDKKMDIQKYCMKYCGSKKKCKDVGCQYFHGEHLKVMGDHATDPNFSTHHPPLWFLKAMKAETYKFSNLNFCQDFNERVRATAIWTTAISSAIIGVLYFLLGHFKIARFVSYVPTSVAEAFLSCVGYKVFKYAIKYCNNEPQMFIPAAIVGVLLYFLKAFHIGNPAIVIPSMLAVPIVYFYVVYGAATYQFETGWMKDQARNKYEMFPEMNDVGFWHIWTDSIGKADKISFDAWLSTMPEMVILIIICVLDALLKISATGSKLPVKCNTDYEIRLYGMGNALTTFSGCSVGYMQLKFNVIAFGVMGNVEDRRCGLIYAFLCGLFFFVPYLVEVFNFLPGIFLSAMLFFAGAGFVAENLYGSRKYLSNAEWGEILIILAVFILAGSLVVAMAVGGFLCGVSFIIKYARVPCISGRPITGDCIGSSYRHPALLYRNLQHVSARWTLVVRLKGFIFFGSAQNVTQQVRGKLERNDQDIADGNILPCMRLKFVVFDCTILDGMDASAGKAMQKLVTDAKAKGCDIIWSGCTPELKASLLQRSILTDERFCFPDLDLALVNCEHMILAYRGAMLHKWVTLHPSFARRAALIQEQIAFEPFKDVFISETSRRGVPWKYCKSMKVKGGQDVLWKPGSIDKGLFLVHSGYVGVYPYIPEGDDIWPSPIAVYGQGWFMNREMILRQATQHYAVALSDAEVLVWSKDDWWQMTREAGHMSAEVLRAVMKQLGTDSSLVPSLQQDVLMDDQRQMVALFEETKTETPDNIPEELSVRLKGIEMARVLDSYKLYDKMQLEGSIMPSLPPVIHNDLFLAFHTFANGGDKMKWADVPKALMYAGLFDTPLMEGNADTMIDEAMFLSIGHEAAMARLPRERVKSLEELFKKYDVDHSGQLERDEFEKVWSEAFHQDLSAEEIDRLADEWDDDRSGTIGLDEFYAIISRLIRKHESDYEMLKAFRELGQNPEATERDSIELSAIEAKLKGEEDKLDVRELLWVADWRTRGRHKGEKLEFSELICAILLVVDFRFSPLPPEALMPSRDPPPVVKRGEAHETHVDVKHLVIDRRLNPEAKERPLRTEETYKEQAQEVLAVQESKAELMQKKEIQRLQALNDRANQLTGLNSNRAKIYLLLDEPDSSANAGIVSYVMMTLILLSTAILVINPLVETAVAKERPYQEEDMKYPAVWYPIEAFFTIIFTIELLVRLAVGNSLQEVNGITIGVWLKNPFNICDFLAILPFYIDLIVHLSGGGDTESGAFKLLRIVRLTRLSRMAKIQKVGAQHPKFNAIFGPVSACMIVIWFIYLYTMI